SAAVHQHDIGESLLYELMVFEFGRNVPAQPIEESFAVVFGIKLRPVKVVDRFSIFRKAFMTQAGTQQPQTSSTGPVRFGEVDRLKPFLKRLHTGYSSPVNLRRVSARRGAHGERILFSVIEQKVDQTRPRAHLCKLGLSLVKEGFKT